MKINDDIREKEKKLKQKDRWTRRRGENRVGK